MAGLLPLGIVVVVATEEAGVTVSCFVSIGIVMVIASEEARFTAASLLAITIIVRITAKQVRCAVSLPCHCDIPLKNHHVIPLVDTSL